MKIIACMCNQPRRLAEALAPVRAALTVAPPISRWGLGYVQGGDTLLVRTPRASTQAVDLSSPLAELATDCMIAQAVRDDRFGGPDNTPPFRFRRWMFAQAGASGVPNLDEAWPRLVAQIPEYLRRNLRGRTPAELTFHLFLTMLHDEGGIEDPNLPLASTRRALRAALGLLASECGPTAPPAGNVAVSNGRSLLVARLGQPLRLRRLSVNNDKGERDEAFRGVLLVSGGDGDPRDGFEDVAPGHAVLVSRDLQVQLAAHDAP
jgi:glutamine amidotransferase